MTYLIVNPFTAESFETEDLDAARTKLAEVKAFVISQEDYRFTVAKELVNGNDTTWTNADLNNDPENGRYHVFNTFTGQHELFATLSSAKTRRLELKEQFATDVGLGSEPKEKPAQPITAGAQDL